MTSQHLATAAEYAPIIERVHGESHPELTRVREITEQLQAATATDRVHLFEELRTITQDYAIPEDVCETFEATYHALARADEESAG